MSSFHHVTHIENLESILKNSLVCRNDINNFVDTANLDIVDKRNELNDYVPFHMDEIQIRHGIPYNKVIKDNIGADNLVFFIINFGNKETIKKLNSPKFFVYHPISNYSIECKDFKEFIEVLNKKYKQLPTNNFGIAYGNSEVKEFLMSEVLIKEEVPINLIERIVVLNNEAKEKVEKICKKKMINILIEVDNRYAR